MLDLERWIWCSEASAIPTSDLVDREALANDIFGDNLISDAVLVAFGWLNISKLELGNWSVISLPLYAAIKAECQRL